MRDDRGHLRAMRLLPFAAAVGLDLTLKCQAVGRAPLLSIHGKQCAPPPLVVFITGASAHRLASSHKRYVSSCEVGWPCQGSGSLIHL